MPYFLLLFCLLSVFFLCYFLINADFIRSLTCSPLLHSHLWSKTSSLIFFLPFCSDVINIDLTKWWICLKKGKPAKNETYKLKKTPRQERFVKQNERKMHITSHYFFFPFSLVDFLFISIIILPMFQNSWILWQKLLSLSLYIFPRFSPSNEYCFVSFFTQLCSGFLCLSYPLFFVPTVVNFACIYCSCFV